MKRWIAVLALTALVGVGCGSSDNNPAAFVGSTNEVKGQKCVTVPATVPGTTIHVAGRSVVVPTTSDLKLCVNYQAEASGTPSITAQPGCGNPCYTVEVDDIQVAKEVSFVLTYTSGGKAQSIGPIGPGPVRAGQDLERVCWGLYSGTDDPCTEVPSPPSALTAVSKKVAKVRLTWAASTDRQGGTISYHVYRSDTGEAETFVDIGAVTTTTFTDATVTSGQSYTYYVQAVDDEGHTSAPSEVATAQAR